MDRSLLFSALQWFKKRYPKLSALLAPRFSTERFTGLPLTLLSMGILYGVAQLSGLVQDYINQDPIIAVDHRLESVFFLLRSPARTQFFSIVTFFGDAGVVLTIAGTLSVILFFRQRWVCILGLWMSIVCSESVTLLGKVFFQRARPTNALALIQETSYSFPSGHATSAVALYGFIAYLLVRFEKSWPQRIFVLVVTIAIIGLIDVSRLYLGVHYLSDVLAGDLVGWIALLFSISVVEWLTYAKKYLSS